MVESCAERGLCVGNTYFENRNLHTYTRVARGQDGMEVKSVNGRMRKLEGTMRGRRSVS